MAGRQQDGVGCGKARFRAGVVKGCAGGVADQSGLKRPQALQAGLGPRQRLDVGIENVNQTPGPDGGGAFDAKGGRRQRENSTRSVSPNPKRARAAARVSSEVASDTPGRISVQ